MGNEFIESFKESCLAVVEFPPDYVGVRLIIYRMNMQIFLIVKWNFFWSKNMVFCRICWFTELMCYTKLEFDFFRKQILIAYLLYILNYILT